MKTSESESNRWRGMALVGIHPSRADMFRLLDDRNFAEKLVHEHDEGCCMTVVGYRCTLCEAIKENT